MRGSFPKLDLEMGEQPFPVVIMRRLALLDVVLSLHEGSLAFLYPVQLSVEFLPILLVLMVARAGVGSTIRVVVHSS